MELTLTRTTKRKGCTLGVLAVDGKEMCDTMEPTWRDLKKERKVKGCTAIPEGRYPVVITLSPKFGKWLPHPHPCGQPACGHGGVHPRGRIQRGVASAGVLHALRPPGEAAHRRSQRARRRRVDHGEVKITPRRGTSPLLYPHDTLRTKPYTHYFLFFLTKNRQLTA